MHARFRVCLTDVRSDPAMHEVIPTRQPSASVAPVNRPTPWVDGCVPLLAAAFLATLPGCTRYQPKPLSLSSTAESVATRSLADPALRDRFKDRLPQKVADWPLRHWDLDDLTVAALHFSPAFANANAQWQTAAAASLTAAGRPNPTIGLQGGYNFDAWRGLPAGAVANPWIPGATADLPIETAGKRRLRIERANHLATVARQNLVSVAWQLRANLRAALIEHHSAQQRLGLLARQIELQAELGKLLDARFQAGAVSRTEVSQQQVARLRLDAESADARRARLESQHRIAEIVGITAAALANVELDPSPAPALAPDSTHSPLARLTALTSRADIRAALASYEAAQSALQIEVARQYPDLHLGSGYQWDQGDNRWSFGLTLELPILNRNQGPIAEAEARRTEAAAQVIAIQARAIVEIERASNLAATLREQLRHARSVLAALEGNAQREEQRLGAGASDQFAVVTARLEATTGAQAVLDVETRLHAADGQLEDALQVPAPPMDFKFPAPRLALSGVPERKGPTR